MRAEFAQGLLRLVSKLCFSPRPDLKFAHPYICEQLSELGKRSLSTGSSLRVCSTGTSAHRRYAKRRR
jgi:hypothetical protein